MYCLSCSHRDVDFGRLKSRMLIEHPTRAAVVAHSFDETNCDLYEIKCFCVIETCTFSMTLCNVYEERLMRCCLIHQTLTTERLNSTLKFILNFHNKHSLSAVFGFLDYVSAFNATEICKDNKVQISEDLDYNSLSPVLSRPASISDVSVSCHNTGTNQANSLPSVATPESLFIQRNIDNYCIVDKTSISDKVSFSVGEQKRTTCDEQLSKEVLSTTNTLTRRGITSLVKTDDDHIDSESLSLKIGFVGSPINFNSFREATAGDDINAEVKMSYADCSTNGLDVSTQQSGKITRTATETRTVVHSGVMQTYNNNGHFYNGEMKTDTDRICNDKLPGSGTSCRDMKVESVERLFQINENSERIGEIQNSKVIQDLKTPQCKNPRQHTGSVNECGESVIDRESINTLNKAGQTRKMSKEIECRSNTGKKLFKCNVCDHVFGHKGHLTVHQRTHTGEKPFKCNECGKCCSSNGNLTKHMMQHTGEKPFKCNECCKTFGQRNNLIKHMRIHTGERPFICNECGKTFVQSNDLFKHKRIHTGERPFKCNECGKTFVQCPDLMKHMRTHTGEKPFKCNECGKTFGQSNNLIQHMNTHTGEKPFKCNECGKTFGQSNNLVKHMRTHTGEKPYRCSECGKTFGHSSTLVKHMKTHTGEKPFKCNECGKAFGLKYVLLKHMKTHSSERTS